MDPEVLISLLDKLLLVLNNWDDVEDDHARTAARMWADSVRTIAEAARDKEIDPSSPAA